MFRTAVTVRSVARAALAPAVVARTSALVAGAPLPRVAGRLAVCAQRSFVPVRMYSAGGALKKEEVEGRIMTLLKGFDKVNDASNIKPTANFANDLGLDSLDTVEVVMAIEEEFSIEIPDKDADTIHSVDKAVDYILNQPDAN